MVIALISFSCASTSVKRDHSSDLEFAREGLEKGQYDGVIADMENLIRDYPKSAQVPDAHFIIGQACIAKIDRERDSGEISGMVLNMAISPLMSKAYKNFVAAADRTNDPLIASNSLYMAGKVLDIYYMRRFEDAMQMYKRVFEEYPGTEAAVRSQNRFDHLMEKFKGLEQGPHKMPTSSP
jgi:TolA-binding protein